MKHIQTICLLTAIAFSQAIQAQDLFERMQQLKQSQNFAEVKQELIQSLQSAEPNEITEDQVLTAGYLQLRETMSTLQNIGNERTTPRTIRWAAYKALARMGDETALAFLISQVERNGMNDDVVAILVPDLIYTQQRQAFDVLIEALYDDTPLCLSSNPDNEVAILCGYRIMEMLAPVIKDFPLELEASGDIKTDSYERSLQELRRWFEQRRTTYEILTEEF